MQARTNVFLPAMSRGTIFVRLLLCMFTFAAPLRAYAQTPAEILDGVTLIRQLQEQVKLLQTQVTALKAQLQAAQQETKEVQRELRFTRTLQRGSRGDEVKKLQEYLAQFPEIYPEGLVTGYYGSLTEGAVRRLQEKQGIEPVGAVGPKTLEKLNELASAGVEDSGTARRDVLAAPVIQPGIAPSSPLAPLFSSQSPIGTTTSPAATSSAPLPPLRTATSTAPEATTTPSGTVPAAPAVPAEPAQTTPNIGVTIPTTPALAATPAAPAATTTPPAPLAQDTAPPVISDVQAISITETSATISWKTDESSDSQVEYGATAAYGSQTALNPALIIGHPVSLSGLTPGAAYHYRVKSKDAAGNLAVSPNQSFTTLSAQTNASPLTISNVTSTGSVNNTSTTHDVGWGTNNPADSLIEYGPTTSYGSRTFSPGLTPTRLMGIVGLTPDTLYHFRVTSKDAAGNVAVSGDYTFRTLATPGGGACVLYAGGLFPTYDAADVGAKDSSGEWPNGAYVKLKKPGISSIADLKNACAIADFDAMFATFCNQVYTNGTQWVVSYDASSGQIQSRECLQGCITRTCPASLTPPPRNLGAVLKALSDALQRLNALLR